VLFSGRFAFPEIFDMGDVLEVFVLGPKGGMSHAAHGVDERVCQREIELNKKFGGGRSGQVIPGPQQPAVLSSTLTPSLSVAFQRVYM
jgi:hypothetical protein